MLVTPPIGTQGNQATCVGWATSTALGILTFPKYECWNIAERSPSYIYNQIKWETSCSSGSSLIDGISLVTDEGSCAMKLMPHIVSD